MSEHLIQVRNLSMDFVRKRGFLGRSNRVVRALDGVDLAEIAITSGVKLTTGEGPAEAFRLEDVAGVSVVPDTATGEKCQRCWMILPEVGSGEDRAHEDLCHRCEDVVSRDAGAAPLAVNDETGAA